MISPISPATSISSVALYICKRISVARYGSVRALLASGGARERNFGVPLRAPSPSVFLTRAGDNGADVGRGVTPNVRDPEAFQRTHPQAVAASRRCRAADAVRADLPFGGLHSPGVFSSWKREL